jgi:hypothetical protein
MPERLEPHADGDLQAPLVEGHGDVGLRGAQWGRGSGLEKWYMYHCILEYTYTFKNY